MHYVGSMLTKHPPTKVKKKNQTQIWQPPHPLQCIAIKTCKHALAHKQLKLLRPAELQLQRGPTDQATDFNSK